MTGYWLVVAIVILALVGVLLAAALDRDADDQDQLPSAIGGTPPPPPPKSHGTKADAG